MYMGVFGGLGLLLFHQWIGFYIRASTSIRFCRLPIRADVGRIGHLEPRIFIFNAFPWFSLRLEGIPRDFQAFARGLTGFSMHFRRKVVPRAGKTEFGSACRRHGSATDPLIKEIKNKTITNIHTHRPIYTQIHPHTYTNMDTYNNGIIPT